MSQIFDFYDPSRSLFPPVVTELILFIWRYIPACHAPQLCALLPCWSPLLIAPWQGPGILPAFVSASAQRVGPERKAKELFTQPLCSTGLSVCPAGSASAGGPFRASEGGWVEWSGVAGRNGTNLQGGGWRGAGSSAGGRCEVCGAVSRGLQFVKGVPAPSLTVLTLPILQAWQQVTQSGREARAGLTAQTYEAGWQTHMSECVYRMKEYRCVQSIMHVHMEGFLNGPTGHRSRCARGKAAPGPEPLFEVTVSIKRLQRDAKQPQRDAKWLQISAKHYKETKQSQKDAKQPQRHTRRLQRDTKKLSTKKLVASFVVVLCLFVCLSVRVSCSYVRGVGGLLHVCAQGPIVS